MNPDRPNIELGSEQLPTKEELIAAIEKLGGKILPFPELNGDAMSRLQDIEKDNPELVACGRLIPIADLIKKFEKGMEVVSGRVAGEVYFLPAGMAPSKDNIEEYGLLPFQLDTTNINVSEDLRVLVDLHAKIRGF